MMVDEILLIILTKFKFMLLIYVTLGIAVFVTLDIIPLNAKFVIRNHPKRYTSL